MSGLSPRTDQLGRTLFPEQAETVAQTLVTGCGRNLPFCEQGDDHQLERVRFAALKFSHGKLHDLENGIDFAQHDWRELLIRADCAERLDTHLRLAEEVLGR